MTPPRPDDEPEDMVSVSLAERVADDQARRAADRARLPAFFFGIMFAAAVGGLFLRDAGLLDIGGSGENVPDAPSGGGLDVADGALILFAALAFAMGTFGEDRIRLWLGRRSERPPAE